MNQVAICTAVNHLRLTPYFDLTTQSAERKTVTRAQAAKIEDVIAEDRLIERDAINLNTVITQRSGMQSTARLVDLSSFGFHARSEQQFRKGEAIRVILPLIGDVRCRVAWTLIGCFGCQFIHPIDERIYSRLLATIKTGRQEWLI